VLVRRVRWVGFSAGLTSVSPIDGSSVLVVIDHVLGVDLKGL